MCLKRLGPPGDHLEKDPLVSQACPDYEASSTLLFAPPHFPTCSVLKSSGRISHRVKGAHCLTCVLPNHSSFSPYFLSTPCLSKQEGQLAQGCLCLSDLNWYLEKACHLPGKCFPNFNLVFIRNSAALCQPACPFKQGLSQGIRHLQAETSICK